MKMTVDQIREYLRSKISGWYENAHIDYGVSGRFLDAQAYGDQLQHLRIIWEEDGKRYASEVSWWTEYTAEQVYNIWMEEDEPEEILDVQPATPAYKQIKNLAQLKRALTRGAAFTISWTTKVPQNRIVNIVQTNGIYSINPDKAGTENSGRGIWLDYGKAAF